MAKVFFALLGLVFFSSLILASPLDDLGAADSTLRAKAAQQIRDQGLFHPTPESDWEWCLSVIKEGESSNQVLAALQAKGVAKEINASVTEPPISGVVGYRLDDTWMIKIAFQKGKSIQRKLVHEPRTIFVPPPSGYNGYWYVYRVDGRRVMLYYLDGVSVGPPTA